MSRVAVTDRARARRAVSARCMAAGLALAGVAGPVAAQVTDTAEYLRRMDIDGDGRISVDEYLAWMMYAFDRMDRNADGVLSGDELPGGRGKPITREQQQQTVIARFHKQDADSDGSLSARELMAPPR